MPSTQNKQLKIPPRLESNKKIKLEDTDTMQKTNVIGRLEENEGATMFFIIEKKEEKTFNFSQNTISYKMER